MKRFEPILQLVALLFGAITFGTAYYLLFLSHPVWSAIPFADFLPVFQAMILKTGTSQIIVSNIALVACLVLFFLSRDRFWLLAIGLLLVSLPLTMFLLMPINIAFLEAGDLSLESEAPEMLAAWGGYQVLRFISDGLAFAAMCKPVIWPKPNIN